MSGHSHYATIKRQKESKDAAKGKVFSKLARGISIAVKSGGGSDPNSNYKLRMAIETARSANMPKDSIERAISRASSSGESLGEFTYEGYGPYGLSVIVEGATDNRNRSAQEIKNIFERGGGGLGGPGSVSFNFDNYGMLALEKEPDTDEQVLKLIDVGIEDVDVTSDAVEVFVKPVIISEISSKIKDLGMRIISSKPIKRPKTVVNITDTEKAKKALDFLEKLEDLEDVSEVYTNIDIDDKTLSEISS
jgi:YebC/PmpR family DNA-binding regulatory protein